MGFLLNNPGFSATPDVSQVASRDSETLPPPSGSGSSSAPSSGDSSRHNCPQCHRRMSKTIFDHYTVCHKYRVWDCLIDKQCDECLDWSWEEMKAYVKHRKSLVSKDKKGKDALPMPPSSPGPVQSTPPSAHLSVSDVDSRISSQLSEMSASFDCN